MNRSINTNEPIDKYNIHQIFPYEHPPKHTPFSGRTPGAGSTKSPEDTGAQRSAAAADLESRGARAFVAGFYWAEAGEPVGNGEKWWFYAV